MKKHLLALASPSLGFGAPALQAKTFTWTASADALSMDPHATNNSFTNAFVGNIYEAWCASTTSCRSSRRWPRRGSS